ncbi:MAG TPA: YbaB/EbfC family nucleoid-associated protein [bacterium]|nr:YbaB/EbfC family nucleoid-associated protein [bacterium]
MNFFNKAAMNKAKQLQKKIMEAQAQLEQSEVTASAGGGMVTAKVNGKYRVTALTIRPEALQEADSELLADTVMSAINQAMADMSAKSESTMGKLTGGLGLPF